MKKNKSIIIVLLIGIFYILLSKFTPIKIPCLFHEITGLYCPGCGVTRMIFSIFKGNMKVAFHYNQLLFSAFPGFLFFGIEAIITNFKGKDPLYKELPNWIWIVFLVLLIVFMIIRNIFPYFAPTPI